MLPDAIQLVLVTPERQLLRETVVEVEIPGREGQLGILPGHAPLMTELGIGELSYKTSASSAPVILAVIQGFAEVLPDRVTVLAETAERAEEINLARAEAAKARAEQRLASNDSNVDWDRAVIALERALIRIQIAQRYQGVPR
ncbi:MAG TPA: F0F1 ATP synthase subunit epsilon [Candidatus Eisenbacteria bacterium]|nr:F0F1 ATP synthase subunit epsilon [Candidatus Eisenbacteria bacterium]